MIDCLFELNEPDGAGFNTRKGQAFEWVLDLQFGDGHVKLQSQNGIVANGRERLIAPRHGSTDNAGYQEDTNDEK